MEHGATSVDILRSAGVFFGPTVKCLVVSGEASVESEQGKTCRIDSADRRLCALVFRNSVCGFAVLRWSLCRGVEETVY